MTDTDQFHHRVETLKDLLRRQHGVRGAALETRLHRAGRRLPKAARQAGQQIVEAQSQIGHPKLARMLDAERLDASFATLTSHLDGYDAADRRKGAVLGTLGALVFNLLLLGAGLIAVLRWQGLV